MRRKRKRKLAAALSVVLALGQAGTAMAGWYGTGSAWKYQMDDGIFASGGWFKDPADGKLYYLEADGSMASGWKLLDGKWYFLNTAHDGTYGAMLAGCWQWIDGCCYAFGPDGAMYAGCVTPDGFTVNADGQWTEGGSVVYTPGKGLASKPAEASAVRSSSGGRGGSGGGGGGGGGSHASGHASRYSYEIRCVDESGNIIKTHTGSAEKGASVAVSAEAIDGYIVTGGAGSYTLTEDGQVFILTYRREAWMDVTVEMYDNADGSLIGVKAMGGMPGDVLSLAGICPDGYEPSGTQPGTFTVGGSKESNTVKLYFDRVKEPQAPEQKAARWTVRFVSFDDPDLPVMPELTGTGVAGEKLPVYFLKQFTDSQGRTWRTDDESPRIFDLKDIEMNEFVIRYHFVEQKAEEDTSRAYSITYTAEDTGSVLGITTGIGNVGDQIPYRNTFTEYSLYDGQQSCRLTDAEENTFNVRLRRSVDGHPEKDPDTDAYAGYPWMALFVDGSGRDLLPAVTGWTAKEDELVIDFPQAIEGDGVTYRAQQATPYRFPAGSTVYRQFVIRYTTGDTSDSKLEQWKAAAQAKKDEFFGTTPMGYYTVYREKESLTDIGLRLGVGYAGEEVTVSAEDFDGYRPYGVLGTFTLNTDGMATEAKYEREAGGTEGGELRDYRVRFTDADGHDLFTPYEGTMAFDSTAGTRSFRIYYPMVFYDALGNRWDADADSPAEYECTGMTHGGLALDAQVKYHLVYENPGDQFIVTSSADVSRILLQYATAISDADRHELYLIGRGYNPRASEISDSAYRAGLTGCTHETEDTFILDGETYYVSMVSFMKRYSQDDRECDHEWDYDSLPENTCTAVGYATISCRLCGKEIDIRIPATGHVDTDYDGLCDACGSATGQVLGDEITVRWTPGEAGAFITEPGYEDGDDIEYHFILIDDDYKGTGKCLYLCEEDVTPAVYGAYAEMMRELRGSDATPSDAVRAGAYTDAESADYGSSNLRQFLEDAFADGLSVRYALSRIGNAWVSMLTKDEYDSYKDSLKGEIMFPDGVFLTKDSDMDSVTLTDGTEADPDEASDYPARPVILLSAGEVTDDTASQWSEGDIQLREIGGKKYLFRCVDAEYSGKTSVSRNLALFLCDTVIPADEGLGFDDYGTLHTRFFASDGSGKNANNYKYSDILAWLNDNCPAANDMVEVDVGVSAEYTGASSAGTYDSVTMDQFKKHTRSADQSIKQKLFILSLEEALAVRDELWRFDCSERNNPERAISEYCGSYWLRTPVYGTTDQVYAVDLATGAIRPADASATDENPACMTGIRPAYVVAQAE